MDINEFDSWNDIKKVVNKKVLSKEFYFRSQEIWWCSLGINVGIEANGKNEVFERPVLILKVFNKEMIWVVPVTSTLKKSPFYYSFKFDNQDYSINITQIKTISAKRLLRKVSTNLVADQTWGLEDFYTPSVNLK